MRRWMQRASVAVAVEPLDPEKAKFDVVALKTFIASEWDKTRNEDQMLAQMELQLAKDSIMVLRPEIYPVLLEVYQEKHPEDFAPAAELPKPPVKMPGVNLEGEGDIL